MVAKGGLAVQIQLLATSAAGWHAMTLWEGRGLRLSPRLRVRHRPGSLLTRRSLKVVTTSKPNQHWETKDVLLATVDATRAAKIVHVA